MASLPRLCCLLAVAQLVAPAILSHGVSAQSSVEGPHSDRLWLAAGLGAGRTGGVDTPFSVGVAGGAGFTYQPSVLLVAVRAGGVWNPFHADILADAALLLGVGTRGQRSHASLAAGPALTEGDLRTFQSAHARFSSQLGLGIHAQVLALPLSTVGVGLIGFANLNRHQSFGGVMLALGVGQLR